jgi:hypothetical protein
MATETRGHRITVAGRNVQLPPDAAITGTIIHASCVAGQEAQCPEVPSYRIQRGESSILVGLATGKLSGERTAAGEERTFDFLKEALR